MTHIVLDIDGTLINETTDNTDINVISRPYLEEFLYFCFNRFETVSIWTAATKDWFEWVDRRILKPIREKYNLPNFFLVWTSEKCSYKKDMIWIPSRMECYWSNKRVKRLKKLWKKKRWGLTKYNTLMLDNTPTTYLDNYGNAIPIPTFFKRDSDDTYLKFLMCYLEQFINKSSSIRTTDKRDWWLDY